LAAICLLDLSAGDAAVCPRFGQKGEWLASGCRALNPRLQMGQMRVIPVPGRKRERPCHQIVRQSPPIMLKNRGLGEYNQPVFIVQAPEELVFEFAGLSLEPTRSRVQEKSPG
jgi:hypothetical protein